jgi:uncharacterized cupin superfamily protein
MANVFDPEFDEPLERPGFVYRRARVGRQAGATKLGASLYEIPPGNASFPYHWHGANEELAIVVSGRPSVRTPEGWRELAEGEVLSFPTGEAGAHQFANRGDEPARILLVSTMIAPEVNGYPDSGKVLATVRPPGSRGDGSLAASFRLTDEVDYWEDEEPPAG